MSLSILWSCATKFFPALQKPTSKPNPIRFVAKQPFTPSVRTQSIKSLTPFMEPLEGRSTPALYLGADTFAATFAAMESVAPMDWLAQPLLRTVNTTAPVAILSGPIQSPWETPSLVVSYPLPLMDQVSENETSRESSTDALFQMQEWAADPYAPSWSAFPVSHNPDSLLLAGLAVIGIPLLNWGEGPREESEIVLPQRRSLKRRKKQKAIGIAVG
ncbi:MAG: hypothetical protein EXS11_00155 [Gemmataceae bacterium]|nr:hypothetical protein [Gemmataceae bacterium]